MARHSVTPTTRQGEVRIKHVDEAEEAVAYGTYVEGEVDEAWVFFQETDTDGSGFLEKAEIEAAIEKHKDEMPDVLYLMSADENADSRLSANEFSSFVDMLEEADQGDMEEDEDEEDEADDVNKEEVGEDEENEEHEDEEVLPSVRPLRWVGTVPCSDARRLARPVNLQLRFKNSQRLGRSWGSVSRRWRRSP